MVAAKKYAFSRLKELGIKHRVHATCEEALSLLMDDEVAKGAIACPPDCFGKRFSALTDPTCKQCAAQIMCLSRCANTVVLEQREKGSWGKHDVAAKLELHPDDVELMQRVCLVSKTVKPQTVNAVPYVDSEDAEQKKMRWPARYMRERQRLPMLKRIPYGALLIRSFAGQTYKVRIRDGFYEVEDQHFPTLYAVALYITGKKQHRRSRATRQTSNTTRHMGNYSAKKFFFRAIEQALPGL
jgi:hypothetical protein